MLKVRSNITFYLPVLDTLLTYVHLYSTDRGCNFPYVTFIFQHVMIGIKRKWALMETCHKTVALYLDILESGHSILYIKKA